MLPTTPVAKVRVYVDAFNVYYGALKNRGPGFKWLDIAALVHRKVPGHQLDLIVYCTARVSDPEPGSRQDRYIAALLARGGVEEVRGIYKRREKKGLLIKPAPPPHGIVTIKTREEKGSDVNLASRLLIDGFMQRYEEAIVMSHDTDLVAPIHHVNHELKKPVTMLFNRERIDSDGKREHSYFAKELQRASTRAIPYFDDDVQACQLPDPVLTSRDARIAKPKDW